MNNFVENKINLYGVIKDKNIKYLDDFVYNYEWAVLKDTNNPEKYVIFDLQTGDIVEENYTIEQVINRVVCRALDYEIEEHYDIFFEDFDLYNHKGYIDYINGLYKVAIKYAKNETKWLFEIGKSIREMTRFFEDINR